MGGNCFGAALFKHVDQLGRLFARAGDDDRDGLRAGDCRTSEDENESRDCADNHQARSVGIGDGGNGLERALDVR
jgi:hypothetical protein